MPRVLIAALATLAACGGDAGADAGVDGGGASDAGARDASVSPDGGGTDAGPVADGGPTDAGEPAVPRCEPSTFMHQGVRRGYILCVPDPMPSGDRPVVLGFHGGGGRAAAWRSQMPWDVLGAREGVIVVYLQGCQEGETDCGRTLGSYLWNVGKPGSGSTVDDQGYTLAVLDRLRSAHGLRVDAARIFATGHSLGGIFAYSLRCDRPELFAAIGPIASPPSDGTCTPSGDTSIYHVHGRADPNVPFDTGCCSRAQQTPANAAYLPACDALPRCFNPANWWPPVRDGQHPFADVVGLAEMASALGCGPTRSARSDYPICEAYDGCGAGARVEECLVEGVGHGLGDLTAAFDIVAYHWARFSTH